MRKSTYLTKDVSELPWTKLKYTCFKVGITPVIRENGYSIIYSDSSNVEISEISVSGDYSIEDLVVNRDSNYKVSSMIGYLVNGENKYKLEVVHGPHLNVVKVYNSSNLVEGSLTLNVKLGSGNADYLNKSVDLVVEELDKNDSIYYVDLKDVSSEIAIGPVMMNGVAIEKHNFNALRFVNFHVNTYFYIGSKIFIKFLANPSNLGDTISFCLDLTKNGLEIDTPCILAPRLIGCSLYVLDSDGTVIKSAGGEFPNMYYPEGTLLKGIGLADIIPAGGSGGSTGDKVRVLEEKVAELTSQVESLESDNDFQLNVGDQDDTDDQ